MKLDLDFRQKLYLSVFLFLVLDGLLLAFGVFSEIGKVEKNYQQLSETKKALILVEKEQENLVSLQKFYGERKEDLVKIEAVFIDFGSPLDFFKFLEENANLEGIEIKIRPTPLLKEKTDPWPSMALQISGQGSFEGFARFLEKLENSPYLLEIDNLFLKKSAENAKEGGEIKADFSLKVYAKQQ